MSCLVYFWFVYLVCLDFRLSVYDLNILVFDFSDWMQNLSLWFQLGNFLDPDFVCRVGFWLIIFQLILNTDLELLPTNCIVFIFRFSIFDFRSLISLVWILFSLTLASLIQLSWLHSSLYCGVPESLRRFKHICLWAWYLSINMIS